MAQKKSDFDIVTQGFIQYLEKTGQISKLPHLAKEQIHLSRTLFDPNLAIVQTVIKLDPQEITTLETKLSSIFKRPIKVTNKINRRLLGGLLIRIGDQILDLSLRSKIKAVKEKLSHSGTKVT